MKASYRHIPYQFGKSFQIKKFDNNKPCNHGGLHLHHSYELVFIKNGKGKIVVEGNEIDYDDGALVFLGPCIPHFSFSNNTYEDNFEIVIHFDDNFVEERIKLFREFSGLLPLIYKSKQFLVFDPETKNKQASLFGRINDLNPAEQLISIFDLICRLSKSTVQKCLIKETIGDRYAQNKQVDKIFLFINENYCRQISTNDVAEEIGLTTNSFCRMFKKLTGKPFIAYLNDYRIHRAAKLLEETDDNVSEIMYQCGFENSSYFAKKFLQLKSLQPIEYRKNFREWNVGTR